MGETELPGVKQTRVNFSFWADLGKFSKLALPYGVPPHKQACPEPGTLQACNQYTLCEYLDVAYVIRLRGALKRTISIRHVEK